MYKPELLGKFCDSRNWSSGVPMHMLRVLFVHPHLTIQRSFWKTHVIVADLIRSESIQAEPQLQ